MRMNTVVTLGASVACAGLAVFLARGWIQDAVTEQAPRGSITQSTAPMASVPVLVADAELRFGDTLAPESVVVVDYPEGSVPTGAMRSRAELFSEPGARIVALTRIVPGEPVLDFKVSLPGSRAALSEIIQPGLRAKAIRVSDAESVAGFVLPGDRVDVLYIRDEEGNTRYGLDMRADVLLQNVRVLGVDQILDDQMDGAVLGATATLEVEVEDVQRLALAEETGTLTLSLRAVGETVVEPVRSMDRASLVARPAPAPKRIRPRAPSTRPVTPPRSDTAKVVVIRGDARDEVSVVSENTEPDTVMAGGAL